MCMDVCDHFVIDGFVKTFRWLDKFGKSFSFKIGIPKFEVVWEACLTVLNINILVCSFSK